LLTGIFVGYESTRYLQPAVDDSDMLVSVFDWYSHTTYYEYIELLYAAYEESRAECCEHPMCV